MHFLWEFASTVNKTQHSTFSLFAFVYFPTNVKQETSNANILRIMHKLNTSIIHRDEKTRKKIIKLLKKCWCYLLQNKTDSLHVTT